MSWLCNQWIGLLISHHQANWLVGWRWLRRSAGSTATTLTRDRGGDTRTHILHFKENANSYLPFLFAQPRRIKTRVFALVCVMNVKRDKMSMAHAVLSLIVHSVDKTSQQQAWFVLAWFPLTKMEKETGLCLGKWRASATKELNSATILAIYVQGHSVYARSLKVLWQTECYFWRLRSMWSTIFWNLSQKGQKSALACMVGQLKWWLGWSFPP